MTIEAIKGGRGQEQARCTCDECPASLVVPAQHGSSAKFKRGGAPIMTLRSESAVQRKAHEHGWTVRGRRLLCPACEARHAAAAPKPALVLVPKEPAMTQPASTSTAPRQPTREQKRQIIDLLNEVYDTAAERYRGKDTDHTVAEVLGSGIMPGWVAQIREELFGPDGGNDELEALRLELAGLNDVVQKTVKDATAKLAEVNAALKAVTEAERKIADLTKRVEAVKAAVGPRARCA